MSCKLKCGKPYFDNRNGCMKMTKCKENIENVINDIEYVSDNTSKYYSQVESVSDEWCNNYAEESSALSTGLCSNKPNINKNNISKLSFQKIKYWFVTSASYGGVYWDEVYQGWKDSVEIMKDMLDEPQFFRAGGYLTDESERIKAQIKILNIALKEKVNLIATTVADPTNSDLVETVKKLMDNGIDVITVDVHGFHDKRAITFLGPLPFDLGAKVAQKVEELQPNTKSVLILIASPGWGSLLKKKDGIIDYFKNKDVNVDVLLMKDHGNYDVTKPEILEKLKNNNYNSIISVQLGNVKATVDAVQEYKNGIYYKNQELEIYLTDRSRTIDSYVNNKDIKYVHGFNQYYLGFNALPQSLPKITKYKNILEPYLPFFIGNSDSNIDFNTEIKDQLENINEFGANNLANEDFWEQSDILDYITKEQNDNYDYYLNQSLNYVNKGIITNHVFNQGKCSSCVLASFTELLEATYNLNNNKTEEIKLSVQYLLEATNYYFRNISNMNSDYNICLSGSFSIFRTDHNDIIKFIMKNQHNYPLESSLPYTVSNYTNENRLGLNFWDEEKYNSTHTGDGVNLNITPLENEKDYSMLQVVIPQVKKLYDVEKCPNGVCPADGEDIRNAALRFIKLLSYGPFVIRIGPTYGLMGNHYINYGVENFKDNYNTVGNYKVLNDIRDTSTSIIMRVKLQYTHPTDWQNLVGKRITKIFNTDISSVLPVGFLNPQIVSDNGIGAVWGNNINAWIFETIVDIEIDRNIKHYITNNAVLSISGINSPKILEIKEEIDFNNINYAQKINEIEKMGHLITVVGVISNSDTNNRPLLILKDTSGSHTGMTIGDGTKEYCNNKDNCGYKYIDMLEPGPNGLGVYDFYLSGAIRIKTNNPPFIDPNIDTLYNIDVYTITKISNGNVQVTITKDGLHNISQQSCKLYIDNKEYISSAYKIIQNKIHIFSFAFNNEDIDLIIDKKNTNNLKYTDRTVNVGIRLSNLDNSRYGTIKNDTITFVKSYINHWFENGIPENEKNIRWAINKKITGYDFMDFEINDIDMEGSGCAGGEFIELQDKNKNSILNTRRCLTNKSNMKYNYIDHRLEDIVYLYYENRLNSSSNKGFKITISNLNVSINKLSSIATHLNISTDYQGSDFKVIISSIYQDFFDEIYYTLKNTTNNYTTGKTNLPLSNITSINNEIILSIPSPNSYFQDLLDNKKILVENDYEFEIQICIKNTDTELRSNWNTIQIYPDNVNITLNNYSNNIDLEWKFKQIGTTYVTGNYDTEKTYDYFIINNNDVKISGNNTYFRKIDTLSYRPSEISLKFHSDNSVQKNGFNLTFNKDYDNYIKYEKYTRCLNCKSDGQNYCYNSNNCAIDHPINPPCSDGTDNMTDNCNQYKPTELEECTDPIDCAGVCGGSAVKDDCNNCVGGTTGKIPCIQDCNGDYGGDAYIDICGVCVEGNTGKKHDKCCGNTVDCNGDCGGSARLNDCNICVEGNTGKTDSEGKDCNNECNGTAYRDNCLICVGGTTGKTACKKDCNNIWGGDSIIDNCGVCNGQNSCYGCDGVPNSGKVNDCNNVCGGSAIEDECGNCVGGTTGKIACKKDCNGVLNGSAFIDQCGNCVGGTTGKTACIQDCNGDWGGKAELNDCEICVNGNTGLTNNEGKDCKGKCNGTSILDNCGVCDGDDSTCTGCDGVLNSGKVNDLCGVCNGDNSTCSGCDGVPNSGKVIDACGECDGGNNECECENCNSEYPFYCPSTKKCVKYEAMCINNDALSSCPVDEKFNESLGVESSKIDGISVNIDASIDKSIGNNLAYYKTTEQVISRLKTLILSDGNNLNVPNSGYDNSIVGVTDIVVKKSNNKKYMVNSQWLNYSLLINMILDIPPSSNNTWDPPFEKYYEWSWAFSEL